MLQQFTVKWSPEREEENVIDGVRARRIVADYEVVDAAGKLIQLPDGHIHGQIAITPGPNLKKRVEAVMIACTKNITKILTERGVFGAKPSAAAGWKGLVEG